MMKSLRKPINSAVLAWIRENHVMLENLQQLQEIIVGAIPTKDTASIAPSKLTQATTVGIPTTTVDNKKTNTNKPQEMENPTTKAITMDTVKNASAVKTSAVTSKYVVTKNSSTPKSKFHVFNPPVIMNR